jgi:hypothetical protein
MALVAAQAAGGATGNRGHNSTSPDTFVDAPPTKVMNSRPFMSSMWPAASPQARPISGPLPEWQHLLFRAFGVCASMKAQAPSVSSCFRAEQRCGTPSAALSLSNRRLYVAQRIRGG